MKEWLDEKEAELNARADLAKRVLALIGNEFNFLELNRLKKMLYRGLTLNDAKIPNHYVRKNGKPVNNKEELDAYLSTYTPTELRVGNQGLSKFFKPKVLENVR
jgi:hypothetical protein